MDNSNKENKPVCEIDRNSNNFVNVRVLIKYVYESAIITPNYKVQTKSKQLQSSRA